MLLNPRFSGVSMLALNREDDLIVNRAVKFRVTWAVVPVLEELREERNEFKAAYLGGGLDFDADRITFGDYLWRWLNDSYKASVRERT